MASNVIRYLQSFVLGMIFSRFQINAHFQTSDDGQAWNVSALFAQSHQGFIKVSSFFLMRFVGPREIPRPAMEENEYGCRFSYLQVAFKYFQTFKNNI